MIKQNRAKEDAIEKVKKESVQLEEAKRKLTNTLNDMKNSARQPDAATQSIFERELVAIEKR